MAIVSFDDPTELKYEGHGYYTTPQSEQESFTKISIIPDRVSNFSLIDEIVSLTRMQEQYERE